MAHDLHIKRLRNRVRCGSAKVARHGRRRIEAIVAKKLREELDVQLSALFSALSIPDEVEIAIRRVSLRLRLSQLDADADDVASAWAAGIIEVVRERLAGRDAAAGGLASGEDVVVFPNRETGELAYLVAVSSGAPHAWWWPHVTRCTPTTLTDPNAVVSRWSAEVPHRIPELIGRLMHEAPVSIWASLSDTDARRWIRQMEGSTDASHTASPLSKVDDRPSRAAPGYDVEIARCARVLSARIGAAPLRRIAQAPCSDTVERFVLRALALSAMPAARTLDASAFEALLQRTLHVTTALDRHRSAPKDEPQRDQARKLQGHTDASETASNESSLFARERAEKPVTPAADAPSAGRHTREHFEPRELGRAQGVETSFGGLLFLIHPMRQTELWSITSPLEFESACLDVARHILHSLLVPLSPPERRAAIEKEASMLRVFAPDDALPDAIHEPLADDRRARAAAFVQQMLDVVGDSPSIEDRALRATLGPVARPSYDEATDTLAAIVLRRGQLVLTETHADLFLPLDSVDIDVRRAGLDVDPGWVHRLGRIVHFHYEEVSR